VSEEQHSQSAVWLLPADCIGVERGTATSCQVRRQHNPRTSDGPQAACVEGVQRGDLEFVRLRRAWREARRRPRPRQAAALPHALASHTRRPSRRVSGLASPKTPNSKRQSDQCSLPARVVPRSRINAEVPLDPAAKGAARQVAATDECRREAGPLEAPGSLVGPRHRQPQGISGLKVAPSNVVATTFQIKLLPSRTDGPPQRKRPAAGERSRAGVSRSS